MGETQFTKNKSNKITLFYLQYNSQGNQVLVCLYSIVTRQFESEAAIHLSGIYTLTCQKILGNPYQCNSSYIRSYISVSNMPGEKQKFIPYLAIVLISPLQQPRES